MTELQYHVKYWAGESKCNKLCIDSGCWLEAEKMQSGECGGWCLVIYHVNYDWQFLKRIPSIWLSPRDMLHCNYYPILQMFFSQTIILKYFSTEMWPRARLSHKNLAKIGKFFMVYFFSYHETKNWLGTVFFNAMELFIENIF